MVEGTEGMTQLIDVDALLAELGNYEACYCNQCRLIAALRQERKRAEMWDKERQDYANIAAKYLLRIKKLEMSEQALRREGFVCGRLQSIYHESHNELRPEIERQSHVRYPDLFCSVCKGVTSCYCTG